MAINNTINFLNCEKSLLIDIVLKHESVIEKKKIQLPSVDDSLDTWKEIAKHYNTRCLTGFRTPKQLQDLYSDLKSKNTQYEVIEQNSKILLDPFEEKDGYLHKDDAEILPYSTDEEENAEYEEVKHPIKPKSKFVVSYPPAFNNELETSRNNRIISLDRRQSSSNQDSIYSSNDSNFNQNFQDIQYKMQEEDYNLKLNEKIIKKDLMEIQKEIKLKELEIVTLDLKMKELDYKRHLNFFGINYVPKNN